MMGNINKVFLMNMVFLWPSLFREEKLTCILSMDTMNNSRAGPAFLLAQKKIPTFSCSGFRRHEKHKDFSEAVNNVFFFPTAINIQL